eukprot:1341353-Amorphochlora_amoeboformis.AAC.1
MYTQAGFTTYLDDDAPKSSSQSITAQPIAPAPSRAPDDSNLFGDDDSDDDLFGPAPAAKKAAKKPPTESKKPEVLGEG